MGSPQRLPGKGPPSPLWLCVRFPRLEVELEPDAEPQRPRAVIDRGRVRMVNEAAERAGIGIGLRTSTAYGICPALDVIESQPDRAARRLGHLAELLHRLSPVVSLEPPDAALTEVAGTLHLTAGLQAVIDHLRRQFAALGHRARFAVGHTPTAALVRSRSDLAEAPDDLSRARMLAEINGLPVALLEPVPGLRASIDLSDALARMGIRRVGQLLALPRAPLGRRFGAALLEHLDRLTGRVAEPRATIEPPLRFRRRVHFLEEITDKPSLQLPMQRLLAELGFWLTAHQMAVTRIDWRCRHERAGAVSLPVLAAAPQSSPARLFELTLLALERIELPERISTLILAARAPVPAAPASAGLFRDLPEGDEVPPAELLEVLTARLGRSRCARIDRADDHRPERAWRRANVPAPGAAQPRSRPLWLLSRPRPVSPAQLTVIRGPERIDAGWWEGEALRPRDYFTAVHASGALCWVFVVFGDGAPEWYLHGYFG